MSTRWCFVLVTIALWTLVSVLRTHAMATEDPATESSAKATTDQAAQPEAPPPAKYKLAYKFQPTQTSRYEVSQESEQRTQMNGETETVKNSSRAKRHFRVVAVDQQTGEADLELWIDWVHMLVEFENLARLKTDPVEFQSDDPQKHPDQFLDILSTIGKPRATIRFSATGKVVKVLAGAIVPPPTAANQLAQGPAAPPASDGPTESFFPQLPQQPVAIGETWRDRFDVQLRDEHKNHYKIVIQQSYRLTEISDGRANIEFRTTVLTPVSNPQIAGQLIERELAGKVVFDIDRGLIVSRESSVDNTVIGPFGPKSSMRAKRQYREKLTADEPAAGEAAESTNLEE
jgi:hypothetical protein